MAADGVTFVIGLLRIRQIRSNREFTSEVAYYVTCSLIMNIYNGIISISLNPSKIFQFIFRQFVSSSSPRQLGKSHVQ